MGKTFLLTALSAVLAAAMATPALAQLSGEGPPPAEYEVKEDGTLIIGGDVAVSCAQIGREDPYLMPGGPEARACEAAGFGTSDDPSSDDPPASGGSPSSSRAAADARMLPETGGSALPALLMAAGLPLAAGCLLAVDAPNAPGTLTGVRPRKAPLRVPGRDHGRPRRMTSWDDA